MRIIGIFILGILGLSIGQLESNSSEPTGFVFHRFIQSACSEKLDAWRINTRIVSKNYVNDSLFLTIVFKEDCCLDTKPTLTYHDSTLAIQLTSKNQEITCECICSFEMTFVITGLSDVAFRTTLNGKEIVQTDQYYYDIYPEKHFIWNNDTINRTNIYGNKIGKWYTFYEDSLSIKTSKTYSGITGFEMVDYMESEEYYPSGKLKSKDFPDSSLAFYSKQDQNYFDRLMSGFRTQNFYENGQMQSDCFNMWSRELKMNIDSCQYWNENGDRTN